MGGVAAGAGRVSSGGGSVRVDAVADIASPLSTLSDSITSDDGGENVFPSLRFLLFIGGGDGAVDAASSLPSDAAIC